MNGLDGATNRRLVRACAIAATWLLALTALNLVVGGGIRGTLFYAVPVAMTAWYNLRMGFVFAAFGALSAWAGGAIPHPQAVDPLWMEGMWAFLKLSSIALGAHLGAGISRQHGKS